MFVPLQREGKVSLCAGGTDVRLRTQGAARELPDGGRTHRAALLRTAHAGSAPASPHLGRTVPFTAPNPGLARSSLSRWRLHQHIGPWCCCPSGSPRLGTFLRSARTPLPRHLTQQEPLGSSTATRRAPPAARYPARRALTLAQALGPAAGRPQDPLPRPPGARPAHMSGFRLKALRMSFTTRCTSTATSSGDSAIFHSRPCRAVPRRAAPHRARRAERFRVSGRRAPRGWRCRSGAGQRGRCGLGPAGPAGTARPPAGGAGPAPPRAAPAVGLAAASSPGRLTEPVVGGGLGCGAAVPRAKHSSAPGFRVVGFACRASPGTAAAACSKRFSVTVFRNP